MLGACIRDGLFQRVVEEFPVGQLGQRIGQAFGTHRLQVFLQLIDFLLGREETFLQLLVGDFHVLGGLHQTFDDARRPSRSLDRPSCCVMPARLSE